MRDLVLAVTASFGLALALAGALYRVPWDVLLAAAPYVLLVPALGAVLASLLAPAGDDRRGLP
jgi:hypothetical protein